MILNMYTIIESVCVEGDSNTGVWAFELAPNFHSYQPLYVNKQDF